MKGEKKEILCNPNNKRDIERENSIKKNQVKNCKKNTVLVIIKPLNKSEDILRISVKLKKEYIGKWCMMGEAISCGMTKRQKKSR